LKIVFFAPHSAIWLHAFPEAVVAEALGQKGHEVLYFTCGRVFDRHCVAMSAYSQLFDASPQAKEEVCRTCERNRTILRQEFSFQGSDIASLLTTEDLAQADRLLRDVSPDNFIQAQFNGIEYGRAALSSFLLVYKKTKLEFSEKEWLILMTEIRHALLSLMAATKVFDREKPDRLLLYSPGYSVNLVWAKLAERFGIPQYYIQGSNNLSDRLQKLIFARGLFWQGLTIKQWERFKHVPCGPEAARYVTDHFLELFRGRSLFAYSLGRSGEQTGVRARFGVAPEQKFLVATMSSYDELFAGEITAQMPALDRGAFHTQIEWMKALIGFVAKRKDLFLLIRVHPREFPNRRDGVKSEHAAHLEQQFTDLPDNIRVNWPSDGVSLYDLAEEMDLCLNAWSNAGKEMTFLGIPVVLYSTRTIFYAPSINYAADTPDEYFRLIDVALAEGRRIDNTRAAFRWYALDDLHSRIDLAESVHFQEHHRPPLPVRAIRRIRRLFNPGFQQTRDCRERAPSLRMRDAIAQVIESGYDSLLDILGPDQLTTVSPVEEERAIGRELRRLAQAMYGVAFERPGGKLKAYLLQEMARE
jgi:hypothetical protein